MVFNKQKLRIFVSRNAALQEMFKFFRERENKKSENLDSCKENDMARKKDQP